jgi:phage-related minor tail protein
MSFITTGKSSFGDLAKAIIADLARIELKALLAKASGAAGGGASSGGGVFSGLVNGVLGIFGGGSSGPLPGSVGAAGGLPLPSFANGGAFSGAPSLHRYVNTVQDKPTPFAFNTLHRFARGGIFAEAGAEAVMPLTRDSSGRLGVRSEGGSAGATHITLNFPGVTGSAAEVRRAGGEVARQVRHAVQGSGRYA